MPRPKKLRPISVTVYEVMDANGKPTGIWEGYLPTGEFYTNGKAKRAHRQASGKDAKEKCEAKIRDLEDELAEKARLKAVGREVTNVYTVHAWLRYWLDMIVRPNRAYLTVKDYQATLDRLILPNLDDIPFTELGAEHIEKMLARIRRQKKGSTDAPQRAFQRLRVALNAAARRPKETGLWTNPCHAVDSPRHYVADVEPLTPAEIRRVMEVAAGERNGARWTVALALGLRQGEALGLYWDDVDLDEQKLWVRWSSYQRTWQHGCADPHLCGSKYHRYPCAGTGPQHDRHAGGCPPVSRPCAPACELHAQMCGSRHGGLDEAGERVEGGMVRKAPKSRAGKRPVPLPGPLVEELERHRRDQDKERLRKGDRWQGDGTVFPGPTGRVLNRNLDGRAWKEILQKAGIRDARLHDARHSTATMLLLKKVDRKVVMEVMGWSSPQMADRYQHVVEEMRREAADAVGELLWPKNEPRATDLATGTLGDLDEARRRRQERAGGGEEAS